KNSVVPFVPIFQTSPYLRLGRAGLEPKEGIGKIVSDIIVLWWKIITFRFSFLSYQFRLLLVLVHVMGDRTHVIEKLGIDRPPAVLVPDSFSDQRRAAVFHRFAQRESLPIHHTITQPLIRHSSLVRCLCRRREPTFIDSPAVGPIRVSVLRMQLNPQSR